MFTRILITLLVLVGICPAASTWYVNPDATGAADGTSVANGYTSLSAAVIAKAADLVTNTDATTFSCSSTAGGADTTHVSITGYTTDSTYDITIIQTDFPTNGVFDDSAYVFNHALILNVTFHVHTNTVHFMSL